MAYTIKKIYDDGRLDVSFSFDNKVQNLAGKTVSDFDILDRELKDYEQAYVDGILSKQVAVDPAVKNIVNQPQGDN